MLKTMPSGKIRLTYQDCATLPENDKSYEVVEGELFVTPAPAPRHQRIAGKLGRTLMEILEDCGLGEFYQAPIDVLLDDENIVQPYIIVIAKENLGKVGS